MKLLSRGGLLSSRIGLADREPLHETDCALLSIAVRKCMHAASTAWAPGGTEASNCRGSVRELRHPFLRPPAHRETVATHRYSATTHVRLVFPRVKQK